MKSNKKLEKEKDIYCCILTLSSGFMPDIEPI